MSATATFSRTDLFAFARRCFDEFKRELASYGIHADPAMELRAGEGLLCYYDLADGHIYISIPDADEPAGQLHMFFMASLMGCEGDHELVQFFHMFIPHLIAHEVAHHLRHRYGLFGKSPWHEEQVANQLAVAMCRHRLPPELRRFAVRIVPPAIATLAEQMESSTIAVDTYGNLPHALNVAGEIGDAALADVALLERLFALRPDAALRMSGRLPEEAARRLERRDELIALIDAQYAAGPDIVRYVYYHLGWSHVGLVDREGHYVDDFARDHLGLGPELLPVVDDAADASEAAIHACYRASLTAGARSAAAGRYFYKRYRALLWTQVRAAAAGACRDAGLLPAPDFGAGEAADPLALLAPLAPAALRSLLPGRIADLAAPDADPARDLPTATDLRLWRHVVEGAEDRAAAGTLERLDRLDRVDALRSLPAGALLEVARDARLLRAAAGEVVLVEGDRNDDVFFLVEGRLEVEEGEGASARRLATIAPGAVFGEVPFFTGRPRSATVRAAEASACFVLKSADLRVLSSRHPAALAGLARALATRLADTRGEWSCPAR